MRSDQKEEASRDEARRCQAALEHTVCVAHCVRQQFSALFVRLPSRTVHITSYSSLS